MGRRMLQTTISNVGFEAKGEESIDFGCPPTIVFHWFLPFFFFFWNYLVKQHCFKVTEKINFFWSSTWISFLEEFRVHRVDLTLLTWPMGEATFKLLASIDPTGIIITNFLHRFKFKKIKKLLRWIDPLRAFSTGWIKYHLSQNIVYEPQNRSQWTNNMLGKIILSYNAWVFLPKHYNWNKTIFYYILYF